MAEERWVTAGRVGRAHGLDGSFHVRDPLPDLLEVGRELTIGGRRWTIVRLAGTDDRPILRLEGIEDRDAAMRLTGRELRVAADELPDLDEDEWWAHELEGCEVRDGERLVGRVRRLLGLPSCDVLEVERAAGGSDLLVPLVSDAVREVDVEGRRIDVDLTFLGEEQ